MRPLLTLVTNFGTATGAAEPIRQNRRPSPADRVEQLRFAFFEPEPDLTIAMIPMDEIHGQTLCDALVNSAPKIIIDLRHVVRFDLPGTNRSRVFNCINSISAFYINESIPWHDIKYRGFSASEEIITTRLFHEIVERENKSIAIMVPKKQHCQILSSQLNWVLSSKTNKKWSIQTVT